MRTGRRPYSVKVGDTWLKYNRFEPLGMLFGVSADLAEIGMAAPQKSVEDIAAMLTASVALNLGDKTFLRGVIDFAQAYADPKRYWAEWATGMAGTALPNIAAQAARGLDPYARDAREFTDKMRARVPGAREALPEKLDIAGQPIEQPMAEPFAPSEARRDPLAEAMLAVGALKGSPARDLQIGGRRYEMTAEEYAAYKAFVQRIRWAQLTPIAASPQFQQLMRAQPLQAKDLIEDRWDKIGRAARDAWLIQHPELVRKILSQRDQAGGSRYLN